MDYVWVPVVAVVVVVGLLAAARGRQGRTRDRELLRALGFVPSDDTMTATWDGRALRVRREGDEARAVQRLEVPLAWAPLAYDVIARALGRGDILAALHALGASAGVDLLRAPLARDMSVKGLRRHVDGVVALARALEAMPQAEGMARWFLELTSGTDRTEALERLVAAFPDAPETLAACRFERDQPRDWRTAARAREHLERVGSKQNQSAGRGPNDDI